MHAWLDRLDRETAVLLALALMLILGFLMTRLTKRLGLPNVSGYILAGLVVGPSVCDLVPEGIVSGMDFVSDMALSFISFGAGRFLKANTWRRDGGRTLLIAVMESLVSAGLVCLVMRYVLSLPWMISLLLGTIAVATSPTSTIMIIQQYHARGEYVNTVLSVAALDGLICLVAYSVLASFSGSGVTVGSALLPVLYNLAVIAVGAGAGLLLSRLITPTRSDDNRLILMIAMLCGISGICAMLAISPLISCIVFGAVYFNLTSDKKLFHQLNAFTPPVMSVFFIYSGMRFRLSSLAVIGLYGVLYIVVRMLGKYIGAFVGCALAKKERRVRDLLGFALIPQSSVAIGLALTGQRILPGEIGEILVSVILATSLIYELIAPAITKAAIFRSGSVRALPAPKPSAEEK